ASLDRPGRRPTTGSRRIASAPWMSPETGMLDPFLAGGRDSGRRPAYGMNQGRPTGFRRELRETSMTEPNRGEALGLKRQREIYTAGLVGKKPAQPVSLEELARKAREVLKPEAFDYLDGGAGSEDTMRANRDAFRHWRLVPRFLRDVVRRDLGVE